MILPEETFNVNSLISQNVNFQDYCPKCLVCKPLGCVHCEICDNCIDEFDHHCYWINRCVGSNNYNTFILFVAFNIIDLIANLVIGTLTLFNIPTELTSLKVYRMLPIYFYTKPVLVGGTVFILLMSLGFLAAVLLKYNQKSISHTMDQLF